MTLGNYKDNQHRPHNANDDRTANVSNSGNHEISEVLYPQDLTDDEKSKNGGSLTWNPGDSATNRSNDVGHGHRIHDDYFYFGMSDREQSLDHASPPEAIEMSTFSTKHRKSGNSSARSKFAGVSSSGYGKNVQRITTGIQHDAPLSESNIRTRRSFRINSIEKEIEDDFNIENLRLDLSEMMDHTSDCKLSNSPIKTNTISPRTRIPILSHGTKQDAQLKTMKSYETNSPPSNMQRSKSEIQDRAHKSVESPVGSSMFTCPTNNDFSEKDSLQIPLKRSLGRNDESPRDSMMPQKVVYGEYDGRGAHSTPQQVRNLQEYNIDRHAMSCPEYLQQLNESQVEFKPSGNSTVGFVLPGTSGERENKSRKMRDHTKGKKIHTPNTESMVQVNMAIVEMMAAVTKYKDNVGTDTDKPTIPESPLQSYNSQIVLESSNLPNVDIEKLPTIPLLEKPDFNFVEYQNNHPEKGDVPQCSNEFPTKFGLSKIKSPKMTEAEPHTQHSSLMNIVPEQNQLERTEDMGSLDMPIRKVRSDHLGLDTDSMSLDDMKQKMGEYSHKILMHEYENKLCDWEVKLQEKNEDVETLTSELKAAIENNDSLEKDCMHYRTIAKRAKDDVKTLRLSNEALEEEFRTGKNRLEVTTGKFCDSVRRLQQQTDSLVSLKADFQEAKMSKEAMEKDFLLYKCLAENAKDEISMLRKSHNSLEQKLQEEKKLVSETKLKMERLNQTMDEAEGLRGDYSTASDFLETAWRKIREFQTKLREEDKEIHALQDTIKAREAELTRCKTTLEQTEAKVIEFNKDKHKLFKENEELNLKLSELDHLMKEVKDDCVTEIDKVTIDSFSEKSVIVEERKYLEEQLIISQDKMASLTEKFKQIQTELHMCHAENCELNRELITKKHAEGNVAWLEMEIKTLTGKYERINENYVQEQEGHEKSIKDVAELKEKLQMQFNKHRKDLGDAQQSFMKQAHEHDLERASLANNLKYKTAELNKETLLAATAETQTTLNKNSGVIGRTVESLRAQLLHEMNEMSTARDKIEGHEAEMEELKGYYTIVEHQYTELKESLVFAKNDLTTEKENYTRLNQEFCDCRVMYSKREAQAMMDQTRLKSSLQRQKDKVYNLQSVMQTQCSQLKMISTSLAESEHCNAQYEIDKQKFEQDIYNLQRSVKDKEKKLSHIRDESNKLLDQIQNDFIAEKTGINKERLSFEQDLSKAKLEVDELKITLKEKEQTVEAYTHTATTLETERRLARETQAQVQQIQFKLNETHAELLKLRSELSKKVDEVKQLQNSLEGDRQHVAKLKDMLQGQRQQYTNKLEDLQDAFNHKMDQHSAECADLNKQLDTVKKDLTTKHETLSSVTAMKVLLNKSGISLKKAVDTLKKQLNDETKVRNVAETKNKVYKTQVNELQNMRARLDDRFIATQEQLTKLKNELSIEKEKYRKLNENFNENHTARNNQDVQAFMIQSELQSEVNFLQGELESQKNTMQGQIKKLGLNLEAQIEAYNNERDKQTMQENDVNAIKKEFASTNNKHFRKLQSEVQEMEERFKDAQYCIKQVTDSLRFEKETRELIDSRYQELKKKYQIQADAQAKLNKLEATHAIVNKKLCKIEKKLTDADAKVHMYANSIAGMEANLSQEQSQHSVTAEKLELEQQEVLRLQDQLHSARRNNATLHLHAPSPLDVAPPLNMHNQVNVSSRFNTAPSQLQSSPEWTNLLAYSQTSSEVFDTDSTPVSHKCTF